MSSPPCDYHEDPKRLEIVVDWEAFADLSLAEKRSFVTLCRQLEDHGWFSGRPGSEWASIDLLSYSNHSEFISKLQGFSRRQDVLAQKRGYYTKFFDRQTFIGDVVAINTSSPNRQGRPMGAIYLRTVEQQGGYAKEIHSPIAPTQNVYWFRHFGTFRAQPGHRQGELVVDEQLVSYMIVRRVGNFALYGTIIGHHDHLKDGVVHKMHHDFIGTALEARNSAAARVPHDASLVGLRYVSYAGFSGNLPGLNRWKEGNLFQPRCFRLDYRPAVSSLEEA